MNLFSLSWKNIRIKPLSTLLSLVLFGLGVGIITILMLLNQQLKEKFEDNLAGIDMVVGAKGSPLQLILSSIYHIDYPTGNISLREAELLEKHPQMKYMIEKTIPMALGDSYKGFRIVGTEHSYAELYKGAIAEGKMWEKDLEVTVGAKVAQTLGLKIGDTFSSSHGFMDDGHNHDENPMTVVSILKKSNSVLDQLILTNVHTIRLVHVKKEVEFDEDEFEDTASEDTADAHDAAANDEEEHHHEEGHEHRHEEDTVQAIDKDDPTQGLTSILVFFKTPMGNIMLPNFINQNTKMQTAVPAFETTRLYEMMGVGTDALQVLAYVIIFISGLSVFISLFNSLKDRKYELALMRVMGGSRLKLFFLIVLEGLIIAFLGYVIGCLMSHFGMQLFSGMAEESYQYSLEGWRFMVEEVYIFLGALGIGILAALLPAWMAYRADISKTLSKN
jgi:putative ABC transport system permease protein